MKKVLFASVVAITMATPAVAADAVVAGPRAEAHIGIDRVKLSGSYDDGIDAESASDHRDGLGYGAEIGYDFAASQNVIIGAYAGVDFSDTKACSEIFGDDEACLKTGRNFTLGLRAGARISPNSLFYVKGGYSNGRIKATYADFVDSSNNGSIAANRDGLHVGAGVEAGLGSRFYAKAEYVYTNYKNAGYDDGDFAVNVDSTRHQGIVGLGVRF